MKIQVITMISIPLCLFSEWKIYVPIMIVINFE